MSLARPGFGFPKSSRILKRVDFRTVYDGGFRHSCRLFAAFCLYQADTAPEAASGPRIGFTVPRSIGKAVVRNRIKRRMREAVRLHLEQLTTPWAIVFNPRRSVVEADFRAVEFEVQRLFSILSERCANS